MSLEITSLSLLDIGPIDLEVETGSRIAIHGESGCGKSVLLKAIADIIPSEGHVALDGIKRQECPPTQWRKRIGLLPPASAWWHNSAAEHFRGDVVQDLRKLGLEREHLEREIHLLSSGEKQRMALLRLLENQPELLLLDEPTTNLDEASTKKCEEMILQYLENKKASLILVSHDIHQLKRMCQHSYLLNDGKLKPDS